MAGKMATGWVRADGASVRLAAPPQLAIRLVSALLALAVAGVHVADQGGITAFNSPDWLGWAFRIIELAGVFTALLLLLPWSGWLGWAVGALLGIGPFLSYLASRSIGLPGDHADVGNWGYWVGTDSLIVEAALVILYAGMLLPTARTLIAASRSGRRGLAGEPRQGLDTPEPAGHDPGHRSAGRVPAAGDGWRVDTGIDQN
jgi:hypothetical protein